MTNCAAYLNPVRARQRRTLTPSLQFQVAAHWSSLCASRPKSNNCHGEKTLLINKLSRVMLILVNGLCGLIDLTGWLLSAVTPPTSLQSSLLTDVSRWKLGGLLPGPQLVMFTVFIPAEEKKKKGQVPQLCTVFRLQPRAPRPGVGGLQSPFPHRCFI